MISRRISPAMQLGVIFLLFGVVWVTLTDIILLRISNQSAHFLSRFQTYKGMLFMIISALLIYFVGRKIFARQQALQQVLNEERIAYRNDLAQEVFNAQEAERKKL